MQDAVRAQIAAFSGVQAISELEVHAESAHTRLLHIHASLVVPPVAPVREAVATLQSLKALLARSQYPVHHDGSVRVQALVAPAGGDAAAAPRWTVSQVDLRLDIPTAT